MAKQYAYNIREAFVKTLNLNGFPKETIDAIIGVVTGGGPGGTVESDEVSISNSATESISGTATTQSELNIENKAAITNLQTLCNILDEEYKKAGFTFTATTTTTDGIDTTVLNVKDKNGNNLLNIDLMGAMSRQELFDVIKDLPAELTNKTIDCGSFNP